ncbi:DUF2958 domain-containing protein, partial [Candidatus Gracilibacteria bacterium]|nr:DUF2958 domain-containing protein [Candidatus Gracilibacteria bacterium]
KYFYPFSNWTWYATEYNEVDKLFFGYVEGFEGEWGYFSLHELQSFKGDIGLGIERDLYFESKPMSHYIEDKTSIYC